MTVGTNYSSQLFGDETRLINSVSLGLPEMSPQFKMADVPSFDHSKNSLAPKKEPHHSPSTPQPFTASWLTDVARMTTMRPPTQLPFSPVEYYHHYQSLRSPFYPSFIAPGHYRHLRNYQDHIRPPDISLSSQLIRSLGPSPSISTHQMDISASVRDPRLHINHREIRSLPYTTNQVPCSSKALVPLVTNLGNLKWNKEEKQNIPKSLSSSAVAKTLSDQLETSVQGSQLKRNETSVSSTSPFYSHFCKGSLVILCEDVVKKIEDLQTKDFLEAADTSQDLTLDPSTIGAITSNAEKNISTILFTFPARNKEITVDASDDHPFFVFHKGWSSCNPDRTFEKYKLEVRKLIAGDICVSLQKSSEDSSAKTSTNMPPPKPPVKPSQSDLPTKSAHIPPTISNKEPKTLNDKEVELNFIHTPKHSNRLKVRPSSRASDMRCLKEDSKTEINSKKRRWSDPEH